MSFLANLDCSFMPHAMILCRLVKLKAFSALLYSRVIIFLVSILWSLWLLNVWSNIERNSPLTSTIVRYWFYDLKILYNRIERNIFPHLIPYWYSICLYAMLHTSPAAHCLDTRKEGNRERQNKGRRAQSLSHTVTPGLSELAGGYKGEMCADAAWSVWNVYEWIKIGFFGLWL